MNASEQPETVACGNTSKDSYWPLATVCSTPLGFDR